MVKKQSGAYDANPLTKALRPKTSLTDSQQEEVRRARKEGLDPDQIAKAKGLPVEDVRVALAPLRTPVKVHTRRTVNISVEAHDKIKKAQQPGETMGQTVDRLIEILEKK